MTGITPKLACLASSALLTLATQVGHAQAPPAPAAPPAVPAAAAPPAAAAKPAAIVNGEPIAQAEVATVVDLVLKQRFRTQPPSDAQRREVWMEVLSMLSDDVLLRQFLTRSNIQVNPADVDKQLNELRSSLAASKPPRSIEDFYKETNQTEANLRVSILNMLRWGEFVKSRLNDAEIENYYKANKDFFDQVAVRASHILIRVAPTAPETDRQAARQKLAALRADIFASKVDFASAAKAHSQCTSAANGGDIGFFPRKMMVDESFARVAFALKPGDVSDVVQTDAGLHLIKVTDRKPGQPSEFAKIKDDVRDFYVEEMRQNLLAQERKSAKIEYPQ